MKTLAVLFLLAVALCDGARQPGEWLAHSFLGRGSNTISQRPWPATAKVTILQPPQHRPDLLWLRPGAPAATEVQPAGQSGSQGARSGSAANGAPAAQLQPALLSTDAPNVPTVFNGDSALLAPVLARPLRDDAPPVPWETARLLAALESVSYCSSPADIASWNCTRCAATPDFAPHEVVYDPTWNVLAFIGYHSKLQAAVIAFRCACACIAKGRYILRLAFVLSPRGIWAAGVATPARAALLPTPACLNTCQTPHARCPGVA